jgi:hypothetical protein
VDFLFVCAISARVFAPSARQEGVFKALCDLGPVVVAGLQEHALPTLVQVLAEGDERWESGVLQV